MTVRVLVVAALVAAFAFAPVLYRRRDRRPVEDGVSLPGHLVAGAARTWVVFTTPWCATCGPVEDRLRAHDPEARIVRVDATAERELAGSLGVRRAPTAVLADQRGHVQTRLVGPEAVYRYLVAGAP